MKYLLMIGVDEARLDAMAPDEMDALVKEHVALDEELRSRGQLVASEALESVRSATTVRVRGGKASITDGPFAETKEQLGGFYLIEAPDLDRAIEVAARVPSARLGSVEVRPVWDLRRSHAAAPAPPVAPA
jgi:hypothetical protein